MVLIRFALIGALLSVALCTRSEEKTYPAPTAPAAATEDAGPSTTSGDAGLTEQDSGAVDSGSVMDADAGAPDAGEVDAGVADAGVGKTKKKPGRSAK